MMQQYLKNTGSKILTESFNQLENNLISYFNQCENEQSRLTQDQLKNTYFSIDVGYRKNRPQVKTQFKFVTNKQKVQSEVKSIIPGLQTFFLIRNEENIENYKRFLKGNSNKKQCQSIELTLKNINDIFFCIRSQIKKVMVSSHKWNMNNKQMIDYLNYNKGKEEKKKIQLINISRILLKILLKQTLQEINYCIINHLEVSHQLENLRYFKTLMFQIGTQIQFIEQQSYYRSFQYSFAKEKTFIIEKRTSNKLMKYFLNKINDVFYSTKFYTNFIEFREKDLKGFQLNFEDLNFLLDTIYNEIYLFNKDQDNWQNDQQIDLNSFNQTEVVNYNYSTYVDQTNDLTNQQYDVNETNQKYDNPKQVKYDQENKVQENQKLQEHQVLSTKNSTLNKSQKNNSQTELENEKEDAFNFSPEFLRIIQGTIINDTHDHYFIDLQYTFLFSELTELDSHSQKLTIYSQ